MRLPKESWRLCRAKVKPGASLQVMTTTKGDWRAMTRYGLVEAVNSFCVRYNWQMTYLTNETHRYLSFALKEIERISS